MSLKTDMQSVLRILVADDDDDEPSVIQLFQEFLPKRGHHLECVESSQQALDALQCDTCERA